MYKASIIISVDNEYVLLNNFFCELCNSCNIYEYELIVVDDACKNHETYEYLEQLFVEGIINVLVHLPEKRGFGQANNIGVDKSRCERLFFINTDVFFTFSTLEKCLRELDRTGAEALQPVLVYPQTKLIQSTGHLFGYLFNRHALENATLNDLPKTDYIQRQALAMAFCLMTRRAFEKAGRFNTFYYNAFECLELTLNISQFGKCIVCTQIIAYHIRSASRMNTLINEEQQRTYFWVNNLSKIHNDYTRILKENLKRIEFTEDKYIAIKSTHLNIFNDIKSCGFQICEYRENLIKGPIELISYLPDYIAHSNHPLLFICDSHLQIKNNKVWSVSRSDKMDIVIDTNGNAKIFESYTR